MEYNSSKEKLAMSEYGRNIQLLVNYAKTIEDDEYRQVFAEKILDLMQQMHPQSRNLEDYRIKLWKHLFRISNFDIEVTPPDGIKPTQEEVLRKPEPVKYPIYDSRFRHYGTNVQKLIEKALTMEEGPKKEGFVAVIGSYMKLAYRTWNKEHYVSDEIIKSDLINLSDGKLALNEDAAIEVLSQSRDRGSKRNNNHHKRGHSKSNNKGGRYKNNRGRK